MHDREKVIKGLYLCKWTSAGRYDGYEPDYESCIKCPYRRYDSVPDVCCAELMRDALELLNGQEEEIEHLKRPDCEHAEHDGAGCLGYCGCTQDDEPIESCKRCEKYTGNISEGWMWDA